MSEPRWHEMTYTEIGVLFRELTADRDRWRKVADLCIVAIGVPVNETDRIAVRSYDEAAFNE